MILSVNSPSILNSHNIINCCLVKVGNSTTCEKKATIVSPSRTRTENNFLFEQYDFGIMIKTQTPLLTIDELVKSCGFFSIGTNDFIDTPLQLIVKTKSLNVINPHHFAVFKDDSNGCCQRR